MEYDRLTPNPTGANSGKAAVLGASAIELVTYHHSVEHLYDHSLLLPPKMEERSYYGYAKLLYSVEFLYRKFEDSIRKPRVLEISTKDDC